LTDSQECQTALARTARAVCVVLAGVCVRHGRHDRRWRRKTLRRWPARAPPCRNARAGPGIPCGDGDAPPSRRR